MKRKMLIAALCVGAVAVVAAVAFSRPAVQDAIVRRMARRQMTPREDLLRYDGMRVVLCGTSSPMPNPDRAQACVLVVAGGRFWIVDTGSRSANNVSRWRVPYEKIAGVLLTHFHSDHIGDLGEYRLQSWVLGRPQRLEVYGPEGVQRVVAGFNEAYSLDDKYRFAHHGAEIADPALADLVARPFAVGSPGEAKSQVIVDSDGLRITAIAVEHSPVSPAVGYRFDYAGRSLVISGDTTPAETIADAARGADVLLHEAQANHMVAVAREVAEELGRHRVAKILSDIPSYHTTPVQAAELARRAGVGLLALYHFTPPPPNALAARIFTRGMSAASPPRWILTEDGTQIDLPRGSSDIVVATIE